MLIDDLSASRSSGASTRAVRSRRARAIKRTQQGRTADAAPMWIGSVFLRRVWTRWTRWTMSLQPTQCVRAAQLDEKPVDVAQVPARRLHRLARTVKLAALWLVSRRYRHQLVRRSRSWRWCQGSAARGGQGRRACGFALRGLRVGVRPSLRRMPPRRRCAAVPADRLAKLATGRVLPPSVRRSRRWAAVVRFRWLRRSNLRHRLSWRAAVASDRTAVALS